jgi:outer membrane biosynthesis protein TonB
MHQAYRRPSRSMTGAPHGSQWGGYSDGNMSPNIKGRVVMVVRVGEDGRVQDCRVVVRAGASLDKNSCAIATRRGRFRPATDGAGKAISAWSVIPVLWAEGQGKMDY